MKLLELRRGSAAQITEIACTTVLLALEARMIHHIAHVLIGDRHTVVDAALKASTLFLTATALFRFTERRTLAEFAPFDWIAAVATGAIVGRSATATDTSWLAATAALMSLLLTHAALTRLRLIPGVQKFIDPPLQVLIRDGRIDLRNLRRSGLSIADLQAVYASMDIAISATSTWPSSSRKARSLS